MVGNWGSSTAATISERRMRLLEIGIPIRRSAQGDTASCALGVYEPRSKSPKGILLSGPAYQLQGAILDRSQG